MQLPGKQAAFTLFGWPVYVEKSVRYGTLGLIVFFTICAALFTDLTPLDSLIAGVIATLLHWMLDIAHQYGHKLAADQTGHPSNGLLMFLVLSKTLYPTNEGHLAPRIHIRRALGGPIMSIAVGLLLLLPASWLWSMGGMAQFLIGIALFETLVVFGIGALLPLDTKWLTIDGGTIWRYWRAGQQEG